MSWRILPGDGECYHGVVGYVRSAGAFSFLGVDQVHRDVDVFPDVEDRASLDGRPAYKGRMDSGTISVNLREFRSQLRSGSLQFALSDQTS